MYTDAHCHLADDRFTDLDSVVARSRAAGVTGWIQGGYDPKDWERQRQLSKRLGPSLRMTFGLHPWWVASASEEQITEALAQLEREIAEACALGETGLDKAFLKRLPAAEREAVYTKQLSAFQQQLALAKRAQKPLVLHVVGAHEDTLTELEKEDRFEGGIVHRFGGDITAARRYLEAGFLLSIAHEITNPANERLRECVAKVPPNSLVLETDCPDGPALAADSASGVNEPASLLVVAREVASLRGTTAEAVLEDSTRAIAQLFP